MSSNISDRKQILIISIWLILAVKVFALTLSSCMPAFAKLVFLLHQMPTSWGPSWGKIHALTECYDMICSSRCQNTPLPHHATCLFHLLSKPTTRAIGILARKNKTKCNEDYVTLFVDLGKIDCNKGKLWEKWITKGCHLISLWIGLCPLIIHSTFQFASRPE